MKIIQMINANTESQFHTEWGKYSPTGGNNTFFSILTFNCGFSKANWDNTVRSSYRQQETVCGFARGMTEQIYVNGKLVNGERDSKW